MKNLSCHKCKRNMGEIELGKIRNGAIILCKECWDLANAILVMAEVDKNTKQNNPEQPFDFNDLFRGFSNKK